MWNWFNCYLSGRHEFGVWCASGAIFVRCIHCGKRSSGISIEPKELRSRSASGCSGAQGPATARVVPFNRLAAGS